MGHAGHAANSLKNNKALKSKRNRFRKARFNQDIPWDTKFIFKTPSKEELKRSKLSNQKYKRQQRRRNQGITLVGFAATLLTIYYLVGMVG